MCHGHEHIRDTIAHVGAMRARGGGGFGPPHTPPSLCILVASDVPTSKLNFTDLRSTHSCCQCCIVKQSAIDSCSACRNFGQCTLFLPLSASWLSWCSMHMCAHHGPQAVFMVATESKKNITPSTAVDNTRKRRPTIIRNVISSYFAGIKKFVGNFGGYCRHCRCFP